MVLRYNIEAAEELAKRYRAVTLKSVWEFQETSSIMKRLEVPLVSLGGVYAVNVLHVGAGSCPLCAAARVVKSVVTTTKYTPIGESYVSICNFCAHGYKSATLGFNCSHTPCGQLPGYATLRDVLSVDYPEGLVRACHRRADYLDALVQEVKASLGTQQEVSRDRS